MSELSIQSWRMPAADLGPDNPLPPLASRNAWFSGGVELNIATTGHSPLTCSPMFACRLEREDGTPVLRLYEWERFRQVLYQVDACLPDGSPLLFLRVRITNPNERDVPMYWWSNIPVPQKPHTRVIAPARAAYCLGCHRGDFVRIPVPHLNGIDFTYACNVLHAADYFFHIPASQRPWIAALDGEGKGLVQVSTSRMMGRKLWAWGTGTGGKNG